MRKQRGFTMAELLIVVAIIAVLVAIAIPVFSHQLEKSRQAIDIDNLRAAYSAMRMAEMTGTIDSGKKFEYDVYYAYDPGTGAVLDREEAAALFGLGGDIRYVDTDKGYGKATGTKLLVDLSDIDEKWATQYVATLGNNDSNPMAGGIIEFSVYSDGGYYMEFVTMPDF